MIKQGAVADEVRALTRPLPIVLHHSNQAEQERSKTPNSRTRETFASRYRNRLTGLFTLAASPKTKENGIYSNG